MIRKLEHPTPKNKNLYPYVRQVSPIRSDCLSNSSEPPFAIKVGRSGVGKRINARASRRATEPQPQLGRQSRDARGFPPFLQRVGTKKSEQQGVLKWWSLCLGMLDIPISRSTRFGGRHTSGARRHMSVCLLRREAGRGRGN